jgi:hypothetical protein
MFPGQGFSTRIPLRSDIFALSHVMDDARFSEKSRYPFYWLLHIPLYLFAQGIGLHKGFRDSAARKNCQSLVLYRQVVFAYLGNITQVKGADVIFKECLDNHMIKTNNPGSVGSDGPQNVLMFLLILLFEVCLYHFFFIKHYSIDCYIVSYDQKHAVAACSSSGRPLLALFIFLFDLFGINIVRSQIFFTVFSIFVLSLSIFYVSKAALDLKKEPSLYDRVFFPLAAVMIFNNIFFLEHFMFTFSLPMSALAMLLTALSARILSLKPSIKRFLIYTATISAIGFIYQGFGGLLIPLAAIFLTRESGSSYKKYITSMGVVMVSYLISLTASVVYIKYVHPFISSQIYRDFNSINVAKMWGNAIFIRGIQYDVWVTHCNMLPKYFFLAAVIGCIILYFVLKKEPALAKNSILGLATLLLSSVLVSFVPHLLSPSIGLAPRTIVGISALPGLIIFLLLLARRRSGSRKGDILIGGTILIYLTVLLVYSNRVEGDQIYANRMDKEYAKLVAQEILASEKESGVTISKLSFVPDRQPTYCYDGTICFGWHLNASVRNVKWGFPFLLRMVSGRSFQVVEMDPSIYETFFKDKNWDIFDKDQVVVKNDTAYVVTY